MPTNVKELIVVLAIALLVFRLARPIALRFSTESDFMRRRRVWLLLTIVAFLSPSFWLFAAIAIPVFIMSGARDSNPGALYLLLLHVIPPMDVPVPMIGMPYIFIANNYLLLSFFVMTPAALRLLRSESTERMRGLQTMDYLLLAYGALTTVLYVRVQAPNGQLYSVTMTDSMRQAFVFFFITFVPYFVISRSSVERRALQDMMASFCLACALMSAIALFESARHWLLYAEMAENWGYGDSKTLYVLRGGSLRASASSGHPLALGYLLVIALAFWLYLQSHLKARAQRLSGIITFWLGLLAAYSRGPWIAGVLEYFVFASLRTRAVANVVKTGLAAAAMAIIIMLSPLHDRVVSVLPFMGGTIDNYNVQYRQRLFDRSWEIIKASPLLGDQTALLKMQDLRQGQGIIDVVNTYLQVLLDNGFVGLTLFLGFILLALLKAFVRSRQVMRTDADLGLLGTSLVSAILATLLLLENGSFGTGTERIFYVLAALAAAYAHMCQLRQSETLAQLEQPGTVRMPS